VTTPGWRLEAPGDLVFIREGAPTYRNPDDIKEMTTPEFRIERAEMGIVVSVSRERDSIIRPTCVFLSKRMKMAWVDAYWCSRF
jgi:hypothetical protein